MALTDTGIRNLKPKESPFKAFDGGGLFLLVNPNGAKWWRLKYRIDGKEKLLSLGVYPDVSLKQARERRDEAAGLVNALAVGQVVPAVDKRRQVVFPWWETRSPIIDTNVEGWFAASFVGCHASRADKISTAHSPPRALPGPFQFSTSVSASCC